MSALVANLYSTSVYLETPGPSLFTDPSRARRLPFVTS